MQAAEADVIYGEDDRVLVEKSPNLLMRSLARSTAVMIKKKFIRPVYDGILHRITSASLQGRHKVCDGERFLELQSAGNCSGFLVGLNKLVTAGHCLPSKKACENAKWVFDYRQELLGDNSDFITYVDSNNVYNCKRILSIQNDKVFLNDYALIELDRAVIDRSSLQFRKKGRIEKGVEVVLIGNPSGLPTIISDNSKVMKNDNDFYFRANLDAFSGNSGSAVINAETGLVEGILASGERDYIFDDEKKCNRVKRCKKEGECLGERVTRITVIPELAPSMVPVIPRSLRLSFNGPTLEELPIEFP